MQFATCQTIILCIFHLWIDICLVNKEQHIKNKLGQRIIQLRRQKGWSQLDLAQVCNKDVQSIIELENGKADPSMYLLLEISKALEVSLKELVDF